MSDNGSGSVVVQNPLSSWDACMSKTYCKWPVIVGIILGGIIVLSIVWCLVRCICGGIIDCCCMCGNCCSSRRRNNYAYQQPPPPPPQYPMYNQYQPPQQPMYSAAPMYASSPMYAPPQMSGGAGHRGAPYEVQNKSGGTTTFNEDALPAMPSWDQGRDRHVAHDDMEMGHIQSPQAAQQQGLLQSPQNNTGDLGAMNAAPAQHYDHDDLNRHGSLYSQGAVSSHAPNRVTSMRTTLYEPSLYPPSYHTQAPGGYYAPGAAAPPPPAGQTIGRKPVPSSWRDV